MVHINYPSSNSISVMVIPASALHALSTTLVQTHAVRHKLEEPKPFAYQSRHGSCSAWTGKHMILLLVCPPLVERLPKEDGHATAIHIKDEASVQLWTDGSLGHLAIGPDQTAAMVIMTHCSDGSCFCLV